MVGANSKDQICLNPDCPDYRKRNTGNIIKKGFNARGNQMFKCKTCGVRFPEAKGTVFYNRHLKEEQIIMICKLLVEKNGMRAIERIMEIHRDTVSDVVEDLARHASLDVYQCYNNLIRVNSALTIKTEKGEKNIERTPCMAEGITDHIWTWKELLMFKILPTIN